MQQIRTDIYESLMVTPVTEFPKGEVDSLGDAVEKPSKTYRGYAYEGFEKVLNFSGEEELSNMQIYLRGQDASEIANTSLISCASAVKQRIIAKKLYRGRDGVVVLGVVYLP